MQNITTRLVGYFMLLVSITSIAQTSSENAKIEHVLHISVDGLRPDVLTSLGATRVPNFFRFRTEGAWTDNARTDVLNTSTIPGHTSHITGRPVFGDDGHGFWWNSEPGPFTLHTLGYKASVFDVVHDNGGSTALYAGKSKFVLFENSYDGDSGAMDITGIDNGRDKIDTYVNNSDMNALVNTFVSDYSNAQYDYAFFHFRYPDGEGHATGWNLETSTAYANKVAEIDALLGKLFQVVETTPGLAGKTAIILTADHGGEKGNKNHINIFDADNYTIPFYVWGPGVAAGADLYALNTDVRRDPGTEQPTDDAYLLPVRYGEVANLALSFLGLPSVPGSVYNKDQSLKVTLPGISQVKVVQQGLANYQGTQDTYIRRHERNNSYGNTTTLLVDDADPWWSGRDNQTLLRFDNLVGSGSSQIPEDSFIQKATLQIRVVNAGAGGTFHRMLKPWNENATWNSMDGGISANNSEAVSQAYARVSDVKKGILNVDVTSSVQAWVNGAPNYGWAILPDGGNGWDFYSSEGFWAPRLVVTYGGEQLIVDTVKQADENTEEVQATEIQNKVPTIKDLKPLLWGNFPNPFTEETTIAFSITEDQQVNLSVYNTNGQLIKTLIDETREAGNHEVTYKPTHLTPGIYILRLVTNGANGGMEQTKKIVLNK